jgi:hypothetical protein
LGSVGVRSSSEDEILPADDAVIESARSIGFILRQRCALDSTARRDVQMTISMLSSLDRKAARQLREEYERKIARPASREATDQATA